MRTVDEVINNKFLEILINIAFFMVLREKEGKNTHLVIIILLKRSPEPESLHINDPRSLN